MSSIPGSSEYPLAPHPSDSSPCCGRCGTPLAWRGQVSANDSFTTPSDRVDRVQKVGKPGPIHMLKELSCIFAGAPLHTSIPRVDSAVVMQIVISWRRCKTEWSRAQSCVTTCVFHVLLLHWYQIPSFSLHHLRTAQRLQVKSEFRMSQPPTTFLFQTILQA